MYLFSFSTSKWSPHDLKYESMSLENPPFESECFLKLLWTRVLEVKTWFCPLSPHCSAFTGSGILWFAPCGLWSQRDRPHSVPMLRTKPTSMAARIPSLCLTRSCKGTFWLSWKHRFAVFLSKNGSCSYNTPADAVKESPAPPRCKPVTDVVRPFTLQVAETEKKKSTFFLGAWNCMSRMLGLEYFPGYAISAPWGRRKTRYLQASPPALCRSLLCTDVSRLL